MDTSFLDSYQLHISTLSPLHIGTGQEYDPTGYVIEDDTLHAFDSAGAARALPDPEKRRLLEIVDGTPGPTMLKQVQAFYQDSRTRLIPVALHAMPVACGVAALYEARVGQTAQREEGGREIINKLGIARTYASPIDHRPVLLGSSLKGAIRTALLNYVNDGASLLPSDGEGESANRKLQERLFAYRTGQFQLDPMRLIQLSDAVYCDAGGLPGTEICFAVNRKKHAVLKAGQEMTSRAEQQNLYQILETVTPMRLRVFSARLNIQRMADGPSTKGKVPVPDRRWPVTVIARACNEFYRPKLEQEWKALRGRGFLDERWQMALTSLWDGGLRAKLDANHAFLLRVGRHSGAEAVTLDGVRSIKIMRGHGQKPENSGTAKTWWLAAAEPGDRRNLIPFGWVLVEITSGDAGLDPWPEVERALGEYAEPHRRWRQDHDQRRAVAIAERARQIARDREEAERVRAEVAAAEERRARLEAMSLEERTMEALHEQLQKDKALGNKQPGGPLNNRLTEMMKQADGWPVEARRQLGALAEAVYDFVGWGKSDKRRQRREAVNALKNAGRGA